MRIKGKEYAIKTLSPTIREVELDERYSLMFASNHTSIMEEVDGDVVVADTLQGEYTDREAIVHALDVIEYFYCCEID